MEAVRQTIAEVDKFYNRPGGALLYGFLAGFVFGAIVALWLLAGKPMSAWYESDLS